MAGRKGAVSVAVDKGWLRLRWRVSGQRYSLAVGLPDTRVNRKVAEQKASKIELDIISGNFDRTLAKYKPPAAVKRVDEHLPITDIFDKFLAVKSKGVDRVTTAKYRSLRSNLERFGSEPITPKRVDNFIAWLKTINEPVTVRRKLEYLNQCYKWAIAQKLVAENPFEGLGRQIKVPVKGQVKPFSETEVRAILDGFKKLWPHYHDYVYFLFATGVRTAEAIGLRWKHLSDECDRIEIVDTITKNVAKKTKTNKARRFRLSEEVKVMLLARKGSGGQEDLVFTSQKGQAIADGNFRTRIWQPVLENAGVEYRKPYLTRATFISHALSSGMNPMAIAALTGHDPETLFEYYAAYIGSQPEIPSLF